MIGMAVVINLEPMLKKRNMGITELSDKIGMSPVNLTTLRDNRAEAIRFPTLDALCKALECKPGDILEYCEDN